MTKSDKIVLKKFQNRLECMREELSDLDIDELAELDLSMAQLQEQIEEVLDAEVE